MIGGTGRWLAAATFGLLAPACGETFEDIGAAVVVPEGASFDANEVDFVSDQPIVARVDSGLIFAACDKEEAHCEIELDGADIVLTAVFEHRRHVGRCRFKEDAQELAAACTSAPIPEGTYTVHYGTGTAGLTIPSTAPPVRVSSGNASP